MSSGYVYRTPILTETKEQSRQRAKDALEKYHFKLIKFDKNGIAFTCDENYWIDIVPFLCEDINEYNTNPEYNSSYKFVLKDATFKFTLDNRLYAVFENSETWEVVYNSKFNYMDLIALLIFPTFLDFNNEFDTVIALMLNYSKEFYMGDENLRDWYSFLVERYHKWSEEADYQVYKMANHLEWDLENWRPPMHI